MYLVQQYISDSFKIKERAFALKYYVLITCISPLTIYVHNDGFCKFRKSSRKTEAEGGAPAFITIQEAYQYMREADINLMNLWQKIKDVIIKTLLSIQKELVQSYKILQPQDKLFDKCFEILTFEIIVDQEEKPWLISVNATPNFDYNSAKELNIKKSILLDSFRMINLTNQAKKLKKEIFQDNDIMETNDSG